jgi:hypothetical protein
MEGGNWRIKILFSMAIAYEEIRRKIAKGSRRSAINRAVLHQNRIKFHAQTHLSANIQQPARDFLSFVQNLIPHDKFKIFMTLFRYPLKTNEITSICFDKLSKIFEGRNPSFDYQFTTSEKRDDWEWYRTDRLHEPSVWSQKGWEFFKSEINSVLIVDLPEDQRGAMPEPYFYWLPIADVVTYDIDKSNGAMSWIAFRQKGERIAVIDNASYRIFTADKAGNIGLLVAERSHDLGYCPARFFWSEAVSLAEPDVKQSVLTKELESLDWFLFYHISKRHLDLYGSYPIYSGYEQACDFSNAENGDYCDGGFLKNKQGFYKFDSAGLLMRCPKCGEKRIAGVGSFVEIPIPADNQPDLRNPVQMLSVDRSSLDYNVEEEERLKNDIITSVVGTNEQITSREAVNEQQVKANFESQSTILNRVKKGFESAQKFVDETCCRLRYGADFLSANINYGTDFYVFDANELRERYKVAKESGASESELDALQNKIIETEYRTNPTQKQRMMVLAELEPYRHLTRDEVLTLYKEGIISQEELRLKLNFNNYIRRFERENTNVLEFGNAIPYQRKIEIINGKLAEYAEADKPASEQNSN